MCKEKDEVVVSLMHESDDKINVTIKSDTNEAKLVYGVLNEEVISRVNDYLDEQSKEITQLKAKATEEAKDAERKINNDYSGITL